MKFLFNNKQSKLTYKRELKGYIFIAPFLIGFFAFVFFPMIKSFIYSFNDLKFNQTITLTGVGLDNYKRALLVDVDFRKLLVSSVTDMLINVPIILIFSMLIAVFLNGKFAGKSIFQVIFFIPVIVSAGIMPDLFSNDLIRSSIINASSMTGEATTVFDASQLASILTKMNLNASFISYIQYAIENIMDVINSSGIQILVFLIALKAIPHSLYEASEIEGATAWECFWKITFPMILPQMLLNVVYTIIDAFSNNTNPVMQSITQYNFEKFQFGYGAALAWLYFAIVIVILLALTGILKLFMRKFD